MEMNSIKIANSLTRKWQTAMALLQHPVSCMLSGKSTEPSPTCAYEWKGEVRVPVGEVAEREGG